MLAVAGLLVAVHVALASGQSTLNFGTTMISSATCDAIKTSLTGNIPLSTALASAGIDLETFPPDCNLQQAFDSACSDAGLACRDYDDIPNVPGALTDVNQLTAYQQSMVQYINCWNGALRGTASCEPDSYFAERTAELQSMKTMFTAVASTTADDNVEEVLNSLELTLEQAITATQNSENYVPAEPTTSGEAGDLDGATVGTIVVASLIGVALVGGAIAVHSGVAGV